MTFEGNRLVGAAPSPGSVYRHLSALHRETSAAVLAGLRLPTPAAFRRAAPRAKQRRHTAALLTSKRCGETLAR
jgi:hypothetical protein